VSLAILYSLEARKLSLRKAKVGRVATVKLRVNKIGGNSSSGGIVEEWTHTRKTADVVEASFRYGRHLIREVR
jgi:hypothetical protein